MYQLSQSLSLNENSEETEKTEREIRFNRERFFGWVALCVCAPPVGGRALVKVTGLCVHVEQ